LRSHFEFKMSDEKQVEKKLNKADAAKDRQRKAALLKRYNTRITVAKQAREAFHSKDYPLALKKYNEYLVIMAEMFEVDDIYKLTVDKFDPKTQVSEMLLISHVYWEMAKIYELTPKFQAQYNQALNQFVHFTINQPYQVLNAEMARKYIKKVKSRSPTIKQLEAAYARIYVESDKCFIATECFGSSHAITNDLRKFKAHLLKHKIGQKLVDKYYTYSPRYIAFSKTFLPIHWFNQLIVKPTLYLFSKLFS
jgi:hypothetical protein